MTGVFANRWWIVFACACGLLVGAGSILIFSFGVFLKPVTTELGITRGELSAGLGISAWFVALACPTVGWLIDRFGTRRVMIPACVVRARGRGARADAGQAPVHDLRDLLHRGLHQRRATPIPYAAVLTHWFDRERGIALGVATAGVGLGVALIPQFAALLIRHFGWRDAFTRHRCRSFLPGSRLQSSCAIRRGLPSADGPQPRVRNYCQEFDASAALRSRTFWLLAIAFFLGVMAINGTIVHIVALLTDRGIPLQTATGALSIAGIAIIVGRMICGWCLDRYWGPYVAVCFFVLPMGGIALLGGGFAYPVPLVGAALCGAGIGAEIDLMAFFISRYFGLKAYGKIYGLMFMLFNLGTGLGPALSGTRVRHVSFL